MMDAEGRCSWPSLIVASANQASNPSARRWSSPYTQANPPGSRQNRHRPQLHGLAKRPGVSFKCPVRTLGNRALSNAGHAD